MTSALKISLHDFQQALSRCNTIIASISSSKPPLLADLDSWRRNILPGLITDRSPPHMTKDELYKLMECKLKRGKSRPLLPLILRNDPASVITHTQSAFTTPDLVTSLSHLCKLTGVGPATAGYILAAQRPEEAVVFSDEAYRWVVCEGDWRAGMKYTKEEYLALVEGVKKVGGRLGVKIEEVERVGFVLGREAVVGGKGNKGSKTDSKGMKAPVDEEDAGKAKGKRKMEEEQQVEKGQGKKVRITKGKEPKEEEKDIGTKEVEQTTSNTSGRILRSRKKSSG
ncbi:hypothetical protein BZA77DRAFT_284139 [Pyronema omphalodes]|nr:hypothetical protein BZA77DRAFT_284139 [Pyronema omphalodes]